MANPYNLRFLQASTYILIVPQFLGECFKMAPDASGNLVIPPDVIAKASRILRPTRGVNTDRNHYSFQGVRVPGFDPFDFTISLRSIIGARGRPVGVIPTISIESMPNIFYEEQAIERATAVLDALAPMIKDCGHERVRDPALIAKRKGLPASFTEVTSGFLRGDRPKVRDPPLPPPAPAGGPGPRAAGAGPPVGGRRRTKKARRGRSKKNRFT